MPMSNLIVTIIEKSLIVCGNITDMNEMII